MHNQIMNKQASVKAAYSTGEAFSQALKHPIIQKGLAGAALGGLVQGGLGYAQDPDADVKNKKLHRVLSALGHGLGGAATGFGLGLSIGAHQQMGGATNLRDALHDPYFQRLVGSSAVGGAIGGAMGYNEGNPENYIDRKSRRGQRALVNMLPLAGLVGTYGSIGASRAAQNGAPGSNYQGPPDSVAAQAKRYENIYDEALHGKALKRFFTQSINSREIADPAIREPFMNFMKSVGRPGADVAKLKAWMESVPGEMNARQLMNVLFNKHHGEKTAQLKMASYVETCLSFGIYTPFQTATW